MGYPNQIIPKIRPYHFAVLVLLLAFCFPVMDGIADPPRSRAGIPPGDWDHVIITDRSLKPAFVPLAKHRKGQELRCRILTTEAIRKWAGCDDTMEAVRWFVATATQRWGTRYVLLGGDAEIIPVPLGYYESTNYSWEIPLDLYYAAHGGQWDVDGDGYLGEIGDDAPDLTPSVALGRAPVSNRSEARAFVNKVIAFENQDGDGLFEALIAAGILAPHPWSPGMEVIFDFARETEYVAEILDGMDQVTSIQRLYQNPAAPNVDVLLDTESFLGALVNGNHRYLGMMVRGFPDEWSLGPDFLTSAQVENLAGMDHPFFMGATIPNAADFRGKSVLESLVTQPYGGCAGALAPSSLYFMHATNPFFLDFWQILSTGECDRVGDAYREVMEKRLTYYEVSPAGPLASFQCLSLVGDPALLFLPADGRSRNPHQVVERKMTASVSPNPFNPITEISFFLPEGTDARVRAEVQIFDLRGRRVARILDTDLVPGLHAVQWNGQDDAGRKVGSGVFFARIQAGEFSIVEKLVLVE